MWSTPLSPIQQVDGTAEQKTARYSFISMYAVDDIVYTVEEIFPKTEFRCTLESRKRVAPLSADHLCILEVEAPSKDRNLSWPEMGIDQAVVFENLRRI